MKKALWPALAGVLLLVAAVYGWYYFPRDTRPSPEALKVQAMSAATPTERQAAAAQLCDWGEEAKTQMREVLSSSDLPEIRAMMIQSLGSMFDYDSMEQLLSALEDDSAEVRARSGHVVRTMLGRATPFDANAPEPQRKKAAEAMRKDWEELKTSPLLSEFKERLKREATTKPSQ